MLGNIYDEAFYLFQKNGSYRSASVILPYMLNLFPSSSVIDIGCGSGSWLRAAQDLGVKSVKGFDGGEPGAQMMIDVNCFESVDFETDWSISARYDLALTLEVAEHVSAPRAKYFVDRLCDASDVVVFGAAIPQQGGRNHINEQWQSYWMTLFERNDYLAFDLIRPLVWENDKVEWWYAQNTFVYISRASAWKYKNLMVSAVNARSPMINVVHPRRWGNGNYTR